MLASTGIFDLFFCFLGAGDAAATAPTVPVAPAAAPSGAEETAAVGEEADAAAAEFWVLNRADKSDISTRKASSTVGASDTGLNGSSSPSAMRKAGLGAAMGVCWIEAGKLLRTFEIAVR